MVSREGGKRRVEGQDLEDLLQVLKNDLEKLKGHTDCGLAVSCATAGTYLQERPPDLLLLPKARL
jgi:hypothetical protein